MELGLKGVRATALRRPRLATASHPPALPIHLPRWQRPQTPCASSSPTGRSTRGPGPPQQLSTPAPGTPGSRLPPGLATGALETRKRSASCVGRESNPGQLLEGSYAHHYTTNAAQPGPAPRRPPRVRPGACHARSGHRLWSPTRTPSAPRPCPTTPPIHSAKLLHAPAAAAGRPTRAGPTGPARLPRGRQPPLGGRSGRRAAGRLLVPPRPPAPASAGRKTPSPEIRVPPATRSPPALLHRELGEATSRAHGGPDTTAAHPSPAAAPPRPAAAPSGPRRINGEPGPAGHSSGALGTTEGPGWAVASPQARGPDAEEGKRVAVVHGGDTHHYTNEDGGGPPAARPLSACLPTPTPALDALPSTGARRLPHRTRPQTNVVRHPSSAPARLGTDPGPGRRPNTPRAPRSLALPGGDRAGRSRPQDKRGCDREDGRPGRAEAEEGARGGAGGAAREAGPDAALWVRARGWAAAAAGGGGARRGGWLCSRSAAARGPSLAHPHRQPASGSLRAPRPSQASGDAPSRAVRMAEARTLFLPGGPRHALHPSARGPGRSSGASTLLRTTGFARARPPPPARAPFPPAATPAGLGNLAAPPSSPAFPGLCSCPSQRPLQTSGLRQCPKPSAALGSPPGSCPLNSASLSEPCASAPQEHPVGHPVLSARPPCHLATPHSGGPRCPRAFSTCLPPAGDAGGPATCSLAHHAALPSVGLAQESNPALLLPCSAGRKEVLHPQASHLGAPSPARRGRTRGPQRAPSPRSLSAS
ncbi:collagen alpha-1(I) chain-like [Lutra lutra]|uniref:collagen alpha-1(I) chain-like n=1 Tax=Lutra lutra TaxID=9657 RepID=UPI001FD30DB5|nr:collagen alpha-1(I) chain-like [Lutra lutra]